MPANLTDLTAVLSLCEPNSTAAEIVRDLCTNGGYLLATHTSTSAWARLANAPAFRDLTFCVKQVNGDRFKVRPSEVVGEVNARKTSDADRDTPRYFHAVREVFIVADDLDTLRDAARSTGILSAFSTGLGVYLADARIVCNNTL
jgi:hypothetical protein